MPLGYGRTYTVSATGLGTRPGDQGSVDVFHPGARQPDRGGRPPPAITRPGRRRDPWHRNPSSSRDSMSHPRPRRRPARPARDHQPARRGAWTWVNDATAHWRPQHYYAPGTTVTVAASIYGVPVGSGPLRASRHRRDVSHRGRAHLSRQRHHPNRSASSATENWAIPCRRPWAWAAAKTIGGRTISFWTQAGSTVMDQTQPRRPWTPPPTGCPSASDWATRYQLGTRIPARRRLHGRRDANLGPELAPARPAA